MHFNGMQKEYRKRNSHTIQQELNYCRNLRNIETRAKSLQCINRNNQK